MARQTEPTTLRRYPIVERQDDTTNPHAEPRYFRTRIDVDKVIRRYTKMGQTMRDIATDIDSAYSTVNRVLTLSGVTKKPRGSAPGVAQKNRPRRQPARVQP